VTRGGAVTRAKHPTGVMAGGACRKRGWGCALTLNITICYAKLKRRRRHGHSAWEREIRMPRSKPGRKLPRSVVMHARACRGASDRTATKETPPLSSATPVDSGRSNPIRPAPRCIPIAGDSIGTTTAAEAEGAIRAALILTLVSLPLVLVMIAGVWPAIRDRYWSTVGRVHYVAVVLAPIIFIRQLAPARPAVRQPSRSCHAVSRARGRYNDGEFSRTPRD
jgi:hypothetical protein